MKPTSIETLLHNILAALLAQPYPKQELYTTSNFVHFNPQGSLMNN
jgi:hypothetical protein